LRQLAAERTEENRREQKRTERYRKVQCIFSKGRDVPSRVAAFPTPPSAVPIIYVEPCVKKAVDAGGLVFTRS
jgi:hypothetical protein